MGILDDQFNEDKKHYLNIIDLIKIIAESKKESVNNVATYFINNLFASNLQTYLIDSFIFIEDPGYKEATPIALRTFFIRIKCDGESALENENYKDLYWSIYDFLEFKPVQKLKLANDLFNIENNHDEVVFKVSADETKKDLEIEYYKNKHEELLIKNKQLEVEVVHMYNVKDELDKSKKENKRLLRLIGAMLEENKQRGSNRANQNTISMTIVEMTKHADAELGERVIKGIFSESNKEFNRYKSEI